MAFGSLLAVGALALLGIGGAIVVVQLAKRSKLNVQASAQQALTQGVRGALGDVVGRFIPASAFPGAAGANTPAGVLNQVGGIIGGVGNIAGAISKIAGSFGPSGTTGSGGSAGFLPGDYADSQAVPAGPPSTALDAPMGPPNILDNNPAMQGPPNILDY